MSDETRRVKRNRWGLFRDLVRGSGSPRFVTAWEARVGEVPVVSFLDQAILYIADPDLRAAIDFLGDQAVGAGFHTSVNEEYPLAEDAKEHVDEYCEDVNLDELNQVAAREIVGMGNSFWHMESFTEIKIMPLTSIDRAVYNAKENVSYEMFKAPPYAEVTGFKQSTLYGGAVVPLDEKLVHFRYQPVNNEAFGIGIARTLCTALKLSDGTIRPSFADMKGKMQRSMIQQFEKFSMPNELWKLPKAAAEDLTTYSNRIKSLPTSGSRFVTNMKDAEVQQIVAERARGFDAYVENITNSFLVALQTPLPKLFTVPGFTEASANAAIEIGERKVGALQRFLKRRIEKNLFALALEDGGFEEQTMDKPAKGMPPGSGTKNVKPKVRLHWGVPEIPEIDPMHVFHGWEVGLIRDKEARTMLREWGWKLEELEEPEEGVGASLDRQRRFRRPPA